MYGDNHLIGHFNEIKFQLTPPWVFLDPIMCLRNVWTPSKQTIFRSFSSCFGLFEEENMGVISFWFSLATTMKNNLRYHILKKGYISGFSQIGSFSADSLFGVPIFGLNYLRHFLINFRNFLCLFCYKFLNFSEAPWWFTL